MVFSGFVRAVCVLNVWVIANILLWYGNRFYPMNNILQDKMFPEAKR
jgi:hypothetical protein